MDYAIESVKTIGDGRNGFERETFSTGMQNDSHETI